MNDDIRVKHTVL